MKVIPLTNKLVFVLVSILLLTNCEKEQIPSVSTTNVSNIGTTSATSGGTITSDGGADIIERGVCWATHAEPTIEANKNSEGTGGGSFSSNLTTLESETTYYVRAYATNSVGTGYGNSISFTTLGSAPSVTVQTPTDITTTSATLQGIVNSNHLSTTVSFEYGTSTGYGYSVDATQSPVTGENNTEVSAGIDGLSPGTLYHYRIKSINELGTTYSDDQTFTTLGQPPSVENMAPSDVTLSSVLLKGMVNPNHFSTTVAFEYGTSTSYGYSVDATQSPVTGETNTEVGTSIDGLSPGTLYHYRIKSINELGTTYSDDQTFTTYSVIDFDGNYYTSVCIGSQEWIGENLKTTHYRNGDAIPDGTGAGDISEETDPEYWFAYNDDLNYVSSYGRLYTWYTVTDSRNICPDGWHVPTKDELTTLETYLGGPLVAGGKLKETGTTHWTSPNGGATNESGFTALPGGLRGYFGTFGNSEDWTHFWTSTEDGNRAYNLYIGAFNGESFFRRSDKKTAYSLRCIKD